MKPSRRGTIARRRSGRSPNAACRPDNCRRQRSSLAASAAAPTSARPGQPPGRQTQTPPRQMPVPGRQTPTPARQLPTPTNISAADRQFLRDDSGISKVGATNRRAPTRRGGGGIVSDEPVGTAGGAKLPLGEVSSLSEWQPLAKKVGAVLAAVAAIGFLGWLTSPYWLPRRLERDRDCPQPVRSLAPTPQATPGADDDQPSKKTGKSEKGKGTSDANKKSGGAGKADRSIILAEAKKPNGDKLGAGSIPGRPGERAEFPAGSTSCGTRGERTQRPPWASNRSPSAVSPKNRPPRRRLCPTPSPVFRSKGE